MTVTASRLGHGSRIDTTASVWGGNVGVAVDFLDDAYWNVTTEAPLPNEWEIERDEYLQCVTPTQWAPAADHPEFSYKELDGHVVAKLRRMARRKNTAKAKERKLQALELLLCDQEYFAHTDDEWRDRSRQLVRRGRPIRSVLARTWADDEYRHDMVCSEWDDHEACDWHDQLRLGGNWQRYHCTKWYYDTVNRSTERSADIVGNYRDYLDDLAEATQVAALVLLITMGVLPAAEGTPRCTDCDVMVAPGEQNEHRYGHARSHFGYGMWLAGTPEAYTTQSFSWSVARPALYYPITRWKSRRDWTTHLRMIRLMGRTTDWQPRPRMNAPFKPVKSSAPARPGNNNYTIV